MERARMGSEICPSHIQVCVNRDQRSLTASTDFGIHCRYMSIGSQMPHLPGEEEMGKWLYAYRNHFIIPCANNPTVQCDLNQDCHLWTYALPFGIWGIGGSSGPDRASSPPLSPPTSFVSFFNFWDRFPLYILAGLELDV